MNKAEFIEMLIGNEWNYQDAEEEANRQYDTEDGDCDGDLAEFES